MVRSQRDFAPGPRAPASGTLPPVLGLQPAGLCPRSSGSSQRDFAPGPRAPASGTLPPVLGLQPAGLCPRSSGSSQRDVAPGPRAPASGTLPLVSSGREVGMERRLLLVSNSTLHGGGYLQHCARHVTRFFGRDVKRVLFVPYALHDHEAYTSTARDTFSCMGYELDSVHEAENPVDAVRNAEAIFIGGGNTFRLLKSLYDNELVTEIRRRVLKDGVPYMGSSAGSNVATVSISTTNDMPIVFPPSFSAIGLVPFNINPHYLEPEPGSRHMGETREQRITQYHEEPDTPCVLGLREGSLLLVEGNKASLLGTTKARLFTRGKPPVEYDPGSDLSFLLANQRDSGPEGLAL